MSQSANMSLLAKTASGAGWVVAFRMITRLLGIVSTLILAHLLGPGDFGLVALASGFAQTVDAVTNLSVHEAIVIERTPDRAIYDTAFSMNLVRGVLTAGVIAATAWPAANFFHEPRLAVVLLALAGSNFVGAMENIATADFMRTFAFHREFQLWTIPRVLQVIATIGFALIWPTYWALVFGIATGRVLRTVLSYVMYPFVPRFTLRAWRRIVGFTTWSWAIYIIVILRDRIDTLLIGRLFSSGQVGIYALGGEIASLPTSELVEPLCRACFPSFSQLRHDGQSVRQTYLRLIGAAMIVVLPAGIGIAAVADPLVKLAFGPRWLEAIPMI
jgi:lipopolysaccharide exporter